MHRVGQESAIELWLVMVFSNQLSLALSDSEPAQSFRADGVAFHATGTSAMSAFYDRLVDQHGELVGVRIAPVMEDAAAVLDRVPPRPYIRRVNQQPWFDVYFGNVVHNDAESDGDQAFGGRFYLGERREMAVSLDLSYLAATERDIEAVKLAPARWVEIGP